MNKKIIFSIILVIALLSLGGCRVTTTTNSISGTGEMVSRNFDVASFNAIDIGGNFEIIYRQSTQVAVMVVMQENLFNYLDVDANGSTLKVEPNRSISTTTGNRPRLYVNAPNLVSASFSGAVDATDWDAINTQVFTINASGAADIDITLDVEHFGLDVSGAVDVVLSGTANTIDIDGSGAINISAEALFIEGGRIDVSGAASVTLSSLENVEINTSGVARVRASD